MTKQRVFLYINYLIGIFLIAFIINCGSSGLDFERRTNSPYFPLIIIATTLELWLIVIYYAWFITYIKAFGTSFTKVKTTYHKFLVIVISMLPIIVLHIVLIKLLLLQRSSTNLSATGYFERDFWIFFFPLFIYAVYIFSFPHHRLYTFDHIILLKKQNLLLKSSRSKVQALLQKPSQSKQGISEYQHPMLGLWRTELCVTSLRHFIKDHFQYHYADPTDKGIKAYQIFAIEKINNDYILTLIDGHSCQLQEHLTFKLLHNPWFISTKKGLWLNMLYSHRELLIDTKIKSRRWIQIDDPLWDYLQKAIPLSRLLHYLESDKGYRDYYADFWNESNLRRLDENRLLERYE